MNLDTAPILLWAALIYGVILLLGMTWGSCCCFTLWKFEIRLKAGSRVTVVHDQLSLCWKLFNIEFSVILLFMSTESSWVLIIDVHYEMIIFLSFYPTERRTIATVFEESVEVLCHVTP